MNIKELIYRAHLYNWYAFTNNYQPGNIDQGEIKEHANLPGGNPNSVENIGPNGSVAGKKYVQGICPDGWHVPSDRDLYIIIEKGANFYVKSIPLRKDFKGNKNA